MKTFPNLIVCKCCHTAYQRLPLTQGDEARCKQCGVKLYQIKPINVNFCLALVVTSLIVFVIANISPVIYVDFHSRKNTSTLFGMALAFSHDMLFPLTIVMVLFFILCPLLHLLFLGWLLVFARYKRRAPGGVFCMKTIIFLHPWSMTEIAVLGILIASIKLSGLLEVSFAAGCWALAILMILMVMINRQNIHSLWEVTSTFHHE